MERYNSCCKISVIVSIYNSAEYMRASLESALSQTLQDIELICVFRRSKDATIAILQEYAQKDNRVKLFEQINTVGCGPAKNQGIQEARGEFITFLDADDLYSSNYCLEKLYNAAKQQQVKVCGGLRSFLLQDSSIVPHLLHREVCKGKPSGVLLHYLDYQFDYHFHSYLYERNMIVEQGFRFSDELTYDDPHFFVPTMLYVQDFYVVPVEMYCYRLGTPYEWNEAQTNASAIGFIEMLKISREKQLAILHWKTVSRINHGEYCANFTKHLHIGNFKLIERLIEANSLVSLPLLEQVQNNWPPRGVLDTQDVCMDPIQIPIDRIYMLKPLQTFFESGRASVSNFAQHMNNVNLENNNQQVKVLQNEINSLKASLSFRVGRVFTLFPRMCGKAFRCYTNYGMSYTVKRILSKLRNPPQQLPMPKTLKAQSVNNNVYVEADNNIASDIKVSIIVPVYNVQAYLRECLDSILSQTLTDIEIICGDGGSTDGSLEILQEYANRDPRIRYISKAGSGYGQSVNECMDLARGEYIGIVESDDRVTADGYQMLYSFAKKNNVDWVRGDIFHYYATNPEKKQLKRESIIYEGNFYNIVLNPQADIRPYKSGMRTWSGIYSRKFLNIYHIRHNETPGGSYQDVGFYLKTLYYAQRVAFINTPFYMWRQDNPGSSIHYNSKKLIEKSFHEWHLNKEYLDSHKELGHRAYASYHYRQFFSYLWTLEMAAPEDRAEVLKNIVEELQEAVKNDEIDQIFFERWEWNKFQHLLCDPNSFCKKYYGYECVAFPNLPEGNKQSAGRAIIKKILKPAANLLRKITAKCMAPIIAPINIQIAEVLSEQKRLAIGIEDLIESARVNLKEDVAWGHRELGDRLQSVQDSFKYQGDTVNREFKKLFFNLTFMLEKNGIIPVRNISPSNIYDDNFYYDNRYGSVISGMKVLRILLPCLKIQSVVDFGCGTGTWLYVAKRLGVQEVCGIDGDYVDRSLLMIANDEFRPYNLEEPVKLPKRYNMAMSLEVAEHLHEETADLFVEGLCNASDIILFSAAHPGQGGDNHINEQPFEYWQMKFEARGYKHIEIRPLFNKDWEVEFWYRDNLALYVADSHFEEIRQRVHLIMGA